MSDIPSSNRKAVGVAFALALLVLISLGINSFWNTRQLIQGRASRWQRRQISDRLDELQSWLEAAETSQRGYLLTGDSSYLDRHQASLESLDQCLPRLDDLTSSDPSQKDDLTHLKLLVAERVAELKQTIEVRRSQGLEPARQIVASNTGKRTMDGVRHLIGVMDNRELSFIQQNLKDNDARDHTRNLVLLLGGLLSIALLILAFYYLNREITGRQRAQDSLRKSDELIRTLFENMLDGFAYCQMVFENGQPIDFIYLDVNNAFGVLTGLSNVVGKRVSEVIPGIRESDPKILETYGRVALSGVPERHEIHVKSMNAWFSISVYSPKKGYFVVLFDGITERKKGEEELVKLNRVYAVASQINQLIVRTRDAKTLFSEACRLACEYGQFRMSWVGLLDDQEKILRPMAWDGFEEGYLTAIGKISVANIPEGREAAGTAIREGKAVCCNDISTDSMMAPWRNEALERGYGSLISLPLTVQGKPIGAFTLYAAEPFFFNPAECKHLEEVAGDISFALEGMEKENQRKRAEAMLVLLRQAVDTSGEVIFMTDREGVFTFVNPEFTRLYGYTAEEVVGKTTPRVLKSGIMSRGVYSSFWRTILSRHVASAEMINMTKGGRLVYAESSANPILDERGEITGFLAIQRDISESKQAKEDIQLAEERFHKAFNTNPEPVTISTLPDGRYIDVNEAFLRTMGYSREEVIGHTSREINYWGDPEKREEFLRQLRERSKVRDFEINFRTKSGMTRSGLLSAETIELDGEQCLLAVTQDITERKELEKQFLQAQKMEAIGKLAGGVAHDFNNLLTVINGYSDMLLSQLQADDPNAGYASEIKKAGDRAAALTRQLLAFSRRQVLMPQVLDLNTIIANMDKMLLRLIGEDVDLIATPGKDLGSVKADPGQVEQIILNLAVNARDAMPEGGKLTVETANVELDEFYAAKHVAAKAGPHVMLAVSDTGTGMDAETQKRIFEPFFTTKGPGKGTGLGLSTVYGIVKQSEGHIWVYSEPGMGTTFKVYLPRVDLPVERTDLINEEESAHKGAETVLIVEDEPSVRALVRTTLESKGYQILEATQGADALAIAKEHHGNIDLLLTDLVMPGISGRVLAEQMTALRPDIKVIYMSGYTDDAMVRHGGLSPGMAFMQKPFTPGVLSRKIREALDGRAA
jgi:PAS domain S-box-containing protein